MKRWGFEVARLGHFNTQQLLPGGLVVLAGVFFWQQVQGGSIGRDSFDAAAHRLRQQDTVFALLAESYRQVQGLMIEQDYSVRLEAITAVKRSEARASLGMLADLERYLRIRKLESQLDRLNIAYDYARESDQREAHIRVPNEATAADAARRLREFSPVVMADLGAPVFNDKAPNASAIVDVSVNTPAVPKPIPPACRSHLALLKKYASDGILLAPVVAQALATTNAAEEPAMILVSYRPAQSGLADVVCQLFYPTNAQTNRLRLARHAGFAGGDMCTPAEYWMTLLLDTRPKYCGPQLETARRQRAYEALTQGDTTLLNEQTVEPLRLVAVMPEPKVLLPTCLRDRVTALIAEGDLRLDEWQGRLRLVVRHEEDVNAVGATLAAWRELASPMVDLYGSPDNQVSIRRALGSGLITAEERSVVVTGATSARLSTRVFGKFFQWASSGQP